MRRGGRAHGCGSSRHAPAAVELLDHDGSIERGVLGDILLVKPAHDGRLRRVSLLAVRRCEDRLAEPTATAHPAQLGDLKIGSDTGTCFKVGV